MKKILHMTPPVINNGVYRYIFNHMQYLDLQNYQFSFLTQNATELKRTKEYKQYGFQICTLCNVERDNPNGMRDEVTRILRDGYDAIHLHTSYWRGFLIEQVAMDMKISKVIVHSHSSGIDESDKDKREYLLEKHNEYKREFSMKYATNVCACSKLAGDWLYGKQIPKEKIQILPNAINVTHYHFQPQIRQKKRVELGIENRVVIGNIGRYCFQKNHIFLLEVFAQACKYNPDLFLLLLGEGELLDNLKNLAKKLGIQNDVCFLKWQEQVDEYLQAMDLFCLPSKFEGLPISVIEAQAAGLHCLVSDFVTKETDITGLVKFIPLDKKQWINEIKNTKIDRHRNRMDECFHKTGYSIQESCKKLIQLYES